MSMKLIVGLGNPGDKYGGNRHNLGYMVADAFAVNCGLTWTKNKDLLCQMAKDKQLIIIKPETYMNDSGESIRAVCKYYKITVKNVLVIADDVDLELGKIRLGFGGSSAGHRGVESAIKSLSTQDFNRLRIGIGRPTTSEVDTYVLSDFLPEEKEKTGLIIDRAVEAIGSYLDDGIMASMNRFN